jgi:hypothetical protein
MGECSYLSTSAISYGSFETSGSLDLPTGEINTQHTQPHSYAAPMVKQPSYSAHPPHKVANTKFFSVAAMPSPTATIPNEYQQKLQEMDAKLQQYQGIEEKLVRMEQMLSALLALPPEITITRIANTMAALSSQL